MRSVASLCVVVLGFGWSGQAKSANILYCVDHAVSADHMANALIPFASDHSLTMTSDMSECETLISSSAWDLVVHAVQNNAYDSPNFNSYVNAGGRAISQDWTRDSTRASAVGVTYGATNYSSMTVTDAYMAAGLSSSVVGLVNPGWGVYSMSFALSAGGTLLATTDAGNGAIGLTRDGRVIVNGMLTDTIDNDADAVRLYTNEIQYLIGGGCDADVDGYSSLICGGTDCDDSDPSVYPGALETWYDGIDSDCDGASDYDDDGDGFDSADYGGTDCDDTASSVNPGATESCNGIDDNCDGVVDEDTAVDASTWYADSDSDGYGDLLSPVASCATPSGYVADATDCDDGRGETNPGATEFCNGTDDDCDGTIDEDDAADAETWYADADSDGYGDLLTSTEACEAAAGWVSDSTDCDDDNDAVNPGVTEVCNSIDDDCDGTVDEDDAAGAPTWYADTDGDGFGDLLTSAEACEAAAGWVSDSTDCDDGNDAVNPDATEVCNSIDDDCDGTIDEDDAAGAPTWYADTDGDGFGDVGVSDIACWESSGWVSDSTDCDDGNDAVNPGATEVCNSIDDDCDGTIDEDDAADAGTWYADADADGYGDLLTSTEACEAAAGWVSDSTDCDDENDAVNPDATEVCNSIDDDCDGAIDEDDAADASTWYADADGDGFGDLLTPTEACEAAPGWVSDSTDCDDGDGAVNPGATEVCNSTDDDCDGTIDEDDAADASTWYADADGDGYGDAAVSDIACWESSGWVSDSTDCDDEASAVNPGATEVCNSIDDDCDGTIDEDDAADASTWYADADGDGYGDLLTSTVTCEPAAGWVSDSTDCDDGTDAVNPGATEVCNSVDDDCDGSIDEDDAEGAPTWYADADGDGYGDAGVSDIACWESSGWVSDSTDCDDEASAVNPGAVEVCNEIDDDCDGTVDEDDAAGAITWYADADGDSFGDPAVSTAACSSAEGWVSDDTDCDDTDALVHPDATEVCDGIDNNCDGLVDPVDATDVATWFVDDDGDGFGVAETAVETCSPEAGWVLVDGDCDDTDALVHPDATEVCDGIDNDCSGVADGPDAVDLTTYYPDLDGDGFGMETFEEICSDVECTDTGAPDTGASDTALIDTGCVIEECTDVSSAIEDCTAPDGYVDDDTDCDDEDPDVYPGAPGLDEECLEMEDTGTGSDTGATGDTGTTGDTGSAEDTGPTGDTGVEGDTGGAHDTGETNNGPGTGGDPDTGGDDTAAADASDTLGKGDCGCSSAARGPSLAWLFLALPLLVGLRRREA